MPLYVYACTCGHNETAFRHIDQRNECPEHCGAPMQRIITAPMVAVDNYEYRSPVSGQLVRGKRQRIEDLKRNRCRPWEGLEAEKSEAAKVRAAADEKLDATFERGAHEVLNGMDADKQQAIKNGLPSP